jgi:hypothetical protein
MCVYLLVGRSLRQWMPVWLYMFPVVLAASVTCSVRTVVPATSNISQLSSLAMGEGVHWGDNGPLALAAFGVFSPSFILAVLPLHASVRHLLSQGLYLGGGAGVLGHTGLSFVLRYLSPLVVSTALLMEPLTGSIIGALAGRPPSLRLAL